MEKTPPTTCMFGKAPSHAIVLQLFLRHSVGLQVHVPMHQSSYYEVQKPKYGSEKKSHLSVFSALLTHENVCWGLVDKRGLNLCDVRAGFLALGLRRASLSQIVQCACDSQTQTKTNGECMSQPCGLYAPGMSWQWCRCECCHSSSPMAQPATKLLQRH